ncbi:MAG: hypothetical protein ACD_19C00140G0010 [uncultured bacterium]|nr:MAG: hypothetical protein ACD_19C00140G0010 [uncultured bacterium]
MSPRYIIRFIQAFFKRFKAIIVIGFVVGILFFLLVEFFLPLISFESERIGIVGRFTTDNMPEEISSKLSNGLTHIDNSGNVSPAIAKSWESPDGGKTWIFEINNSSTWDDGQKIKAADIDYQFSDATIEVINDNTIKFNLTSQFSAFPIIVSRPLFKKGLIGNGEWTVKNLSLSAGYIQKLVISNKDKSNNITHKITYKFYPSDDRLRLAFKLGQIDKIAKTQDSLDFESWKTVNISREIGYDNLVALFLNTDDEKFNNKSFRQNVAYAIDKSDFDGVRAIGPLSPNSWGYNSQVKQYALDLDKAKDAKDSKIIISTLPNLLKTAEKIKNDWEDAGIQSEIQVVTNVPENYQAFLATIDIPKDPDQYSLWHSTQTSTNISHLKNPRIDKLLEDGRTELDQETRKKIYLDFQRFLVEEVPAVFLYHPTYYTITRK